MVTESCRCRYCGQESELPLYFTLAKQRIVNYLLTHPWSTVLEIERGVYGRTTGTNVVTNALSHIRKNLKGTGWKLDARRNFEHPHQCEYKITKPTRNSRTIQDVNVNSPHSLP